MPVAEEKQRAREEFTGLFSQPQKGLICLSYGTMGLRPDCDFLLWRISLSADDRFLFVDTFMDGTCRVYDVSDPHQPKLVLTEKIGSQVNMVSETWDGKRVYFTSSLLANWDKTGKDNEQFLKAYGWDGKRLTPLFAVDFLKEGLGRPHIMHFGQERFYKNQIYTGDAGRLATAR